jgi:hypothetical protein
MYFPFRALALTGSLVVAAASYAQASPLDPDRFLDPHHEETLALIAQDLAALASGSGSQVGEPLSAADAATPEPFQELAVLTAAEAPTFATPPDPATAQSVQSDDMQAFVAGEFERAPAPAETTGSILADASPEVPAGAPGDEAAALALSGQHLSPESSDSADRSGEMSPNFMP